MHKFLRFLRSEEGPTAVEYAVMLALIIVVVVGSVLVIGQTTANSYSSSGNSITTFMSSGS